MAREEFKAMQKSSQENISIDVKDMQFGAKGDGITDDLIPIQNALNYASIQGYSTVLFKDGTYIISNRLIVPSNITIIGINACLKLAENIPLTVKGRTNWTGGTLLWLENVQDVHIINLNMDGNKNKQQVTTNGIFNIIQLKGVKNINIKGCTFHDAANGGIQVAALNQEKYPLSQNSIGVQNLTITENTFYNLQQAIQVTESNSHSISINKNNIYNTTSHGISTYPGTKCIFITDNNIKDIGLDTINSHGAGIRLLEVEDAFVSNNIVENPYIHGIYVNTNQPALYKVSNRVTISNNTVKGGVRLGAKGCGIATNGNNMLITSNTIFDFTANGSSSHAVQVIGDHCTVTENTTDNTNNGICANGKNTIISKNSIMASASYGIVIGVSLTNNASIVSNGVSGRYKTTVVGIRIFPDSRDSFVSGNHISSTFIDYQDTGEGTIVI